MGSGSVFAPAHARGGVVKPGPLPAESLADSRRECVPPRRLSPRGRFETATGPARKGAAWRLSCSLLPIVSPACCKGNDAYQKRELTRQCTGGTCGQALESDGGHHDYEKDRKRKHQKKLGQSQTARQGSRGQGAAQSLGSALGRETDLTNASPHPE